MNKLTKAQERIHVDNRFEFVLNANLHQTSASELERKIAEAVRELTYYEVDGYTKVDDPSHGYLIVPPFDKNYRIAQKFNGECSRAYQMADGTILLEEDCDATGFLEAVQGTRPIPGVQYALTGATGTKAISNGNTWAESRVDNTPKT